MQSSSSVNPHIFVLCPDREYARGLRQNLVYEHGTLHLQVGVFEELIQLATVKRMLDLEPQVEEGAFVQLLSNKRTATPEAFWAKSFEVDLAGVSATLLASIDILINAKGPQWESDWSGLGGQQRISERLGQLWQIAVAARAAKCLSAQTQRMLDVMDADTPAITPIYVVSSALCDNTSLLKQAFLERLKQDCAEAGVVPDDALLPVVSTLTKFDQGYVGKSLTQPKNNLDCLKDRMFKQTDKPMSAWKAQDDTVRWVRCRDTLEGLELLIGAIQKAMGSDSRLTLADFGILIPRAFNGHSHLKTLFERASLPLANLRWIESERNLAGELLCYALMAFEGGCPKLALNSLMSNPLLPWPAADSVSLIASLDRSGLQFKVPAHFKSQWKTVLDDFRGSVARTELPQALLRLKAILKLENLSQLQLDCFDRQFETVIACADNPTIDFEAIRQHLDLSALQTERSAGTYLDGITVWYEDYLPWQPVKTLFVIDFVDGNYPAKFQMPAVLNDVQWRAVAERVSSLQLAKDQRAKAQKRFVSQLNQVTEKVVMFYPAFDAMGKSLNTSESLLDCALIAACLDSPESLLLDVREPGDHLSLQDFQMTESAANPIPRYELEPSNIELGLNLLERFKTKRLDEATGQWLDVAKPQSPSALDDLLLCPLGWFLKQIGAENRVWEPDGFTPATSGLIAHDVLENLFAQESTAVPSEVQIRESVEPLFTKAIKQKAPFLNNGIWKVERQNLLEVVRKAAIAWAELLNQLEAKVVAPELWLEGTFDGHPIHGQTDCVIALPDESVLVVDFKTSKADKYSKRMGAQFDLQASLYEQMLKTGGPKHRDKARAAGANLKKLSGVVYFTLKDRLATSNFHPTANMASWQFVSPPDEDGQPSVYSKDVSSKAMALLKDRFEQLRAGKLMAVDLDEIKHFADVGFQQYIFESSPLIKAAVMGGQDDSEEEDE